MKKKVLLITPNFNGKKSWMKCAQQTASNLSKADFDVTILTTNTENQFEHEMLNGLLIHRVKSFLLPDPINMSVPNPFAFWKKLKEIKADIIIINKTWFVTSLLGSIYCKLYDKEYYVQLDTIVGKIWFGTNQIMNVAMWIYARTLNKFILKGAKKAIIYHKGIIPAMNEWNIPYKVISQGVDVKKFANAKPAKDILEFKKNKTCFLFVGRLDDIKRWQEYKEACKNVYNIEKEICFVWVVGDKHKEKRLNLQKEMSQYNTLVLGYRDDVANIMKACEVLVLPSKCEGMPDVLMEAQASGLCCIAANVGGIPFIIDNFKTGILFDYFSTLEIDMLFMKDKIIRETYTKPAKESIKQHDNSVIIQKLKEIFK